MVDRLPINLPASERPLDFKDFSYAPIFVPSEIIPEIYVRLTFTFGRRNPNEFSGHVYRIFNGDKPKSEAESFLNAAQNAWARYKWSEENKAFVQKKLREKWKELEGEKLTGQKLEFD